MEITAALNLTEIQLKTAGMVFKRKNQYSFFKCLFVLIEIETAQAG